ncbi:glycine cleavage T C-terminal barrel domain-containing protein, partial [Klebsiella pneumoniae]
RDPERPQLVGIVPLDHQAAIRSGAHILEKNASWTLENDQGYVTSTAFSPHVGSKIGLALVKRGAARHGEEVIAYDSLQQEF